MKKLSIIAAVAAFMTALFACTPQQIAQVVTAKLSASEHFDNDNKAIVTVIVTPVAATDVTITLAVDETPTDAIKATAMEFHNSVKIPAGSNTAVVDVTLKTVPNGDAKAYFSIVAAQGAKADATKAVILYSAKGYDDEGGEGGEGEGGEGGQTSDMTIQNNWSVTITGDELEMEEDEDYTYYYIAANLTAPGATYVYTDCFFDDEDFAKYGGASVEEWAKTIETSLKNALKSYSIDDLLYTPGDLYLNYYDSGAQYVYVLDFDAKGSLTGKYAIIPVTMPEFEGEGGEGGEEEGELDSVTLMNNWKVDFVESYYDNDEEEWFDTFKVTAPGLAQKIYLMWMTDDDLAEYETDLEVVNNSFYWALYEYYNNESVDFFTNGESVDYYHEAGSMTVYLVEMDEDTFAPSGRYGKGVVTVPETDTDGGGANIAKFSKLKNVKAIKPAVKKHAVSSHKNVVFKVRSK